jgi:hypothetical protein
VVLIVLGLLAITVLLLSRDRYAAVNSGGGLAALLVLRMAFFHRLVRGFTTSVMLRNSDNIVFTIGHLVLYIHIYIYMMVDK